VRTLAIAVMAGALFAAGLHGTALAQGATTPDPVTLPEKNTSETVVVPGTLERPLPPPDGDPRTPQQRRRDARAYDRCVSKAQSRMEDITSANPVADNPEDYCSRRLGMKDRDALPDSRLRRQ